MPGFLSKYSETPTVYMDETEEYWVKVRRYLRRADFAAAQAVLVSPIMRYVDREGATSQAETEGEVDSSGYQNELVARALVEWNLTDEEGNLIPLGKVDPIKGPDAERRAAIAILPEEPFEKILEAIEGGAPKKKEPAGDAEKKPEDPFRNGRTPRAVGARTRSA